jgi:hypothetical protein
MSKLATTTSIRRLATTIALAAGLALPPLAAAMPQQYQPPAQGTVVNQDYRSPDAQTGFTLRRSAPVAAVSQRVPSDLRSPDAREAGRFLTAAPVAQADTSNDPNWLAIGLGSALALVLAGAIVTTARRHRHELGFGH